MNYFEKITIYIVGVITMVMLFALWMFHSNIHLYIRLISHGSNASNTKVQLTNRSVMVFEVKTINDKNFYCLSNLPQILKSFKRRSKRRKELVELLAEYLPCLWTKQPNSFSVQNDSSTESCLGQFQLSMANGLKLEVLEQIESHIMTEDIYFALSLMDSEFIPLTNENRKERITTNQLPRIYFVDPSKIATNISELASPCSITAVERQNYLYQTLREWILFARKHHIIWWITFGTLLGSVRAQHLIPYDSDMDFAILGSAEPLLRKLQTSRLEIKPDQFHLILRPGEHCAFSGGDRMNCQGQKVERLSDSCAFCGPLARIFNLQGYYIDLYPVHVHIDFADNDTLLHYFDEGLWEYTEEHEQRDLRWIFPLKQCEIFGLTVPCPNNASAVLSNVYGDDFMTPKWKCNMTSKEWQK